MCYDQRMQQCRPPLFRSQVVSFTVLIILICLFSRPWAYVIHCTLNQHTHSGHHQHGHAEHLHHGSAETEEHPLMWGLTPSFEECQHDSEEHRFAQLVITDAVLSILLLLVPILLAHALPLPRSTLLRSWHPPPLLQPPRS